MKTMKTIKTIFLSLMLLFLCGVGVMAEGVTMPTQYIDAQGQAKNVTFNGIIGDVPTDQESVKEAVQTNPPTGTTLTPSKDGSISWYWAGKTVESPTTPTTINVSSPLSFGDNPSGIVNIVVGPNGKGGVTAMLVAGGLDIPNGVTVNIYQAADGLSSGTPVTTNCFLQFNGQAQPKEPENSPQTPQAGITVEEGGELNVLSGAIIGQGSAVGNSQNGPATAAPGISISGKVTVGAYGTLQGNSTDTSVAGITVNPSNTKGSLSTNGAVCSFYNEAATGNVGRGCPMTGLSNLTVNGGSVSTSTTYDEAVTGNANLTGGIWLQTNNADGLQQGTAFGTSTYLYTGGYSLNFGDTESLTVLSTANLTISNGTIKFGTQNGTSSSTNAQLNIQSGGNLTIGSQANINMYANSTLDNKGNINVE